MIDTWETIRQVQGLKYLWDGIGDWIELYKKFEGGFCLEQNYTQNIRRRWHCKDVSSHCCKVASRRVLMRSILTIMLETKNELVRPVFKLPLPEKLLPRRIAILIMSFLKCFEVAQARFL
jgi:hypothetical protein